MGNLVFQATLGGQVNLVGPNTASTFNLNVPAVAGTLVTTGDTGTVTNTMLAGSIANAKLLNSSVTVGSTSIALGASATTVTGLTLTSPTLTTPVLGTPASGTLTNCTGLPNAGLVNSSVTIGGTAIALGASSSTITNDLSISGLTVGKGAGAVSTNTAVGASALNGTNTGGYTTALGYQAGYSNTSGQNTLVGANSGQYITTGTRNTGVGVSTLGFNNGAVSITSNDNTAQGHAALTSLTSGASNTAIGSYALLSNTTASNNTAVGYQAGYSSTTSNDNTYLGYQAGYNKTTGAYNTFLGGQAGYGSAAVTGRWNTVVGYASGFSLTTGEGNTFVGSPGLAGAGYYMTTGSKNTILGGFSGNNGGLDIRTASNYIVLSDGDGAVRMFASPTYVNLGGAGSADTSLVYSYGTYNYTSGGSANMGINSSGFMYRSTSSLKYKKNIQDATHGLAEVLQLRPVTYESKQEAEAGNVYGGLIAEEVHATGLTEFVQYSDDGSPDALAYGNMVSLLIKSIQELKTIVDAQAAEIAELKAKVGI